MPCCLRFNFACLLGCLAPIKKRPHAPGTHATRRNIAVAIPLAFNKRLQQHMRSTTLDDEDGPQAHVVWEGMLRLFEQTLTSETRLAFGKCAPDRHLAPRETPRAHSDTAGETADRHHGHTATQQERGQTDTATQHPDQSGLHPYNRTGLEPNRVRNPDPVSKLQLKPLIYIYEINKKKN
mgnify:CR=1 FL=1